MKTVAAIGISIVVVGVFGFGYINSCIDSRVSEFKHSQWVQVANEDVKPVLEPENALSVVLDTYMQPFGMSYEDELTAVAIAQPTRIDLQVSKHYAFLQGGYNEQNYR